MTCPDCGHVADARAKFCSECGASLRGSGFRVRGSGALEPRTLNPEPRSYTPPHLVDKILSSRSALQGERKHVTVLFADIVASMELAAQVDAESWHEILDRFFAILAEGIHRVEGTINQYTGDGAMALFGAPIAHEDHAQRACQAALTLRAELRRFADALRISHGLSFSVRMGLNSGEVVVGRIGDDLRMDYTAQGQTVGLAARMQQLAEPGSVLLTAQTAQLVAGYFALRDLGPARVKGVSEALQVFELEGAGPLRTRLDRSRARGFANFVGRREEMAALETALQHATAGAGEVAGVEGDAGVGKSRLCTEFVNRCRGHGVSVYEAHCLSHGRTVPFLPILALLRSYFSISERDGAAAAREKIAGRLLVRDDSARAALPLLYDFLGVVDPAHPAPRMDPEARQRHLFAFVRRLVEARPGETVLLFLDDLHWIDAASDAFVAQLVDAVAGTHTLLLLNYRPEYRAAWMQRPFFRRIAVAPLARAAADAFLDELVGTDPVLAPLRALILERTAGNPFFIEEIVQCLRSDGTLAQAATRPITDVRIPETVHAVLAARIDRLGELDKAVLQTAAVIGKRFDATLLRRVLETLGEDALTAPAAALQHLRETGMIVDDSASGDERFAFKHPLTQEVAYRSQLGARRELVHRAVAGVLQQLHADKLDEVAALLAHHLEQAAAPLDAARWHRRAAEWTGISDMAEAVRHTQRVRELVAGVGQDERREMGDGSRESQSSRLPSPDSRLVSGSRLEADNLRIWAAIRLLDFGWRSGMSTETAAGLFEEGRALAERLGDVRATANLVNTYGIVVGMSGDVDGGLALVTEGEQIARRTGDRSVELMATVALVQAQSMAGALQLAEDTLSEVLANEPAKLGHGAITGGFSPYLYLVMMRGHVRTEMGRLREAQTDIERVLSQAGERGEIELLGWAHEFVVYLELALGTPASALDHALGAVDSAEKIGSPLSQASAYYCLGAAQNALGHWKESIAANEYGLGLIRARSTGRHWESRGLALLAEALAGAGELERARTVADEAEAASLRGGNRVFECFSCLAIVRARRLAEGAGARASIESTLARVETIVAASDAGLYTPWVYEERAALAGLLGDDAIAQQQRVAARDAFIAIGADAHAARISETPMRRIY